MGKITEIKLVGQPIFKQIMNLVDKVDIHGLIKKHESYYYYKSFKTRTHLFTMLFGIFSRCDSEPFSFEVASGKEFKVAAVDANGRKSATVLLKV